MKISGKKVSCLCLSLAVLIAVVLVVDTAIADRDYEQAKQLRKAGKILPLETILQKLRASYPGKVLEVELEREHGQVIYEIEILDNQGKVWKLKVNAMTGELLKRKYKKDD